MSQRNSESYDYPLALQSTDLATLFDVALITVLPVASVMTYFLSTSLQYQLAFDPHSPTAVNALTAPIVHIEQAHLLWNMFGYLTLIPLTYALTSLAGRRRLFRVVFVIATVGTPLLTSGAEIMFNSDTLSGGLSGVLFVFIGFLPLALGAYLEAWFDISSSKVTGPLMQFLSIFIVVVMGAMALTTDIPSSLFVPLGGALALGALAIVYTWCRLTLTESSPVEQIIDQPLFGDLALCAVALSLLLPLLLVYPMVSGAGGGVSSVAHYVGFLMGTFTPLFFL